MDDNLDAPPPPQRRLMGCLISVVGALITLSVLGLGIAAVFIDPRGSDKSGALIFGIAVVVGLLTIFVQWDPISLLEYRIHRWAERHTLPLGKDILSKDSRPPILYLRSFLDDEVVTEEEEALAKVLAPAGPFVAIGRPGEQLPPFGAARFYIRDDRWQEFVTDFLERACLVALVAGRTPGLGWEVQQCRQHVQPCQFLVIVPSTRETYEAFQKHARDAANLRLPDWTLLVIPRRVKGEWRGYLTFSSDWEPRWTAFGKLRWSDLAEGTPDNVGSLAETFRQGLAAYAAEQNLAIMVPPALTGFAVLSTILNISFLLGFLAWVLSYLI